MQIQALKLHISRISNKKFTFFHFYLNNSRQNKCLALV